LPQSRELWRNTATTLKAFFSLDTRHPLLFDAFLSQWEGAEDQPEGKQMVWDWKRGFGSRAFQGLEQLDYWMDQLRATSPGTPNGDYVDGTIRRLISQFGARELNALLASWRVVRGGVPQNRAQLVDNLSLINPFQAVVEDGPELRSLGELLDVGLIRRRYPTGLPEYGPLVVDGGKLTLRTDPYGCPWRLVDGRVVVSPGQLRASYEQELRSLSAHLRELAQKNGRWPTTLDEATAEGLSVPALPDSGTLRLDGHQVVVDWAVEAGPPWPLRSTGK
jgi:hypothetical protein